MLRLAQAAREFGVSTRTLERWIYSGEVKPTLRTLGGHARFSIEDIERYKAMLREKHEPKPFDWEGEAARMQELGDKAPWRIRRTPRGNYYMAPNRDPTPEELKRHKKPRRRPRQS